MKAKKLLHIYLYILATVILLTGINPKSRIVWILEVIFIAAAGLILLKTSKKFTFSKTSYTLVFIYLLLVTIGAYFTYENVPLDTLKDILGLERNPHDRIVHFCSGALLFYPVFDFFKNTSKVKNKLWLYLTPVLILFAFASIYELVEWFIAINVEPNNAAAFLGMQGDQWDSQKDMFMNLLGSILAMVTTATFKGKNNGKNNSTRRRS